MNTLDVPQNEWQLISDVNWEILRKNKIFKIKYFDLILFENFIFNIKNQIIVLFLYPNNISTFNI